MNKSIFNLYNFQCSHFIFSYHVYSLFGVQCAVCSELGTPASTNYVYAMHNSHNNRPPLSHPSCLTAILGDLHSYRQLTYAAVTFLLCHLNRVHGSVPSDR